MSFDIFLQGFRGGEAREIDPAPLRELIDPHVIERDEGFVRLRLADGGADVYGLDDETSLMVNHCTGRAIWDLLVEVARRADLVILAPGLPVVMTSERTRAELPRELAADAIVVERGDELRRSIEST